MSDKKLDECLRLLREADALLLERNEMALACHLSLVIERLAARLDPR
jgi:hypothetical protein